MRIFFAYASSDDWSDQERYFQIRDALSGYGEVISDRREVGEATDLGNKPLHKEIYEEQKQRLLSADLFVAEVSLPSLGVGYEIALAESRGIRTLALFCKKEKNSISVMLAGNRSLDIREYQSRIDIDRILQEFF